MVTNAGRLKFRVESSNKELGAFYTVEFNDQNGECNCRDFVVRCQPAYRQSKITVEYGTPQYKTRCKHINQVLIFIANKAISGVLK